jgi:hypothetical protein
MLIFKSANHETFQGSIANHIGLQVLANGSWRFQRRNRNDPESGILSTSDSVAAWPGSTKWLPSPLVEYSPRMNSGHIDANQGHLASIVIAANLFRRSEVYLSIHAV